MRPGVLLLQPEHTESKPRPVPVRYGTSIAVASSRHSLNVAHPDHRKNIIYNPEYQFAFVEFVYSLLLKNKVIRKNSLMVEQNDSVGNVLHTLLRILEEYLGTLSVNHKTQTKFVIYENKPALVIYEEVNYSSGDYLGIPVNFLPRLYKQDPRMARLIMGIINGVIQRHNIMGWPGYYELAELEMFDDNDDDCEDEEDRIKRKNDKRAFRKYRTDGEASRWYLIVRASKCPSDEQIKRFVASRHWRRHRTAYFARKWILSSIDVLKSSPVDLDSSIIPDDMEKYFDEDNDRVHPSETIRFQWSRTDRVWREYAGTTLDDYVNNYGIKELYAYKIITKNSTIALPDIKEKQNLENLLRWFHMGIDVIYKNPHFYKTCY